MKMIEINRLRSSIGIQPAEKDDMAGIKGPCSKPIRICDTIKPPASPTNILKPLLQYFFCSVP